MDFIGTLEQTAKEYPDRIAICSSANEEGITYSELDEYTGRITGEEDPGSIPVAEIIRK